MENKIMILKNGCIAQHVLGELTACNDREFICIVEEKDDQYIGHFVEGFGLRGLKFNKEDCRELTDDERKYYQNSTLVIL